MKTLTKIIGTGAILAGIWSTLHYANMYGSQISTRNPELVEECSALTIEAKFEQNWFGGGNIDEKFKNISADYNKYQHLNSDSGLVEQCKLVNEYRNNVFGQISVALASLLGFGGIGVLWMMDYNRRKMSDDDKTKASSPT